MAEAQIFFSSRGDSTQVDVVASVTFTGPGADPMAVAAHFTEECRAQVTSLADAAAKAMTNAAAAQDEALRAVVDEALERVDPDLRAALSLRLGLVE
jgi:ApbE superfamily uncharacterized protein (UPF0280 family)